MQPAKDKLAELGALVDDAVAKKTADKCYLQLLVGKLCIATCVYYVGQSILWRVVNVINKLRALAQIPRNS